MLRIQDPPEESKQEEVRMTLDGLAQDNAVDTIVAAIQQFRVIFTERIRGHSATSLRDRILHSDIAIIHGVARASTTGVRSHRPPIAHSFSDHGAEPVSRPRSAERSEGSLYAGEHRGLLKGRWAYGLSYPPTSRFASALEKSRDRPGAPIGATSSGRSPGRRLDSNPSEARILFALFG